MITLFAGTLYPAYRSYKAIRTKDVREYVKWMMYWVTFALYIFFENILDLVLAFWFPFYFQLKIVFMFWLLSPWTKGASIIYRKWVHPYLMRHEKDIDALLDQAKSESYNQILRFGSRTILVAKEIVTEAAVRGQQQLVNQIQRSYSANDVSTEGIKERKKIAASDVDRIDEIEEHQPDEMDLTDERPKRQRSRSRSRNIEGSDSISNTMPRRSTRRNNQEW